MTSIFWDTMLLIYLLEGNEDWSVRARQWLIRSRERGDRLFTSSLALGEVMAGARGDDVIAKSAKIRAVLLEAGFQFLLFDSDAADLFGRLRAVDRVAIADSIHLACAAAHGMDLFLTGDRALTKLHVPGIKFIADFNTSLL
jgi:predicted nucleic acid-binding protein